MAVKQLTDYLESNRLMPLLQSAYRRHHSTETALLKILSDALIAADDKKITLLALLELSAAFDCVDYDILLSKLQCKFGLGGAVLGWIRMRSYLSDSTHGRVCFCGCLSSILSDTILPFFDCNDKCVVEGGLLAKPPQNGCFVTPLLKKASLDPHDLKNYRPVSDLSYVYLN